MNVLVYLLPMALGLGLAGLFAFLWSLWSGQYEDLEGASLRVLADDDVQGSKNSRRQFKCRRPWNSQIPNYPALRNCTGCASFSSNRTAEAVFEIGM